MKKPFILNKDLKNFSDEELIKWVNGIQRKIQKKIQRNKSTPIQLSLLSKSIQLKLLIEFNRRGWNSQNIILNSTGELVLDCPITVHENIIFETNTPLPSMVGRFFQKTLGGMLRYIDKHPLLKDKRLVSFDFVIDQIYFGSRVKKITIEDLPKLTENDVIVYITQYGKTFPNRGLLAPFVKSNVEVIFDKGVGYRFLEKVDVICNSN